MSFCFEHEDDDDNISGAEPDQGPTEVSLRKIAQFQKDLPDLIAQGRHLEASYCLGMTAHELTQLGRFKDALRCQHEAIEQVKKLGPNDPEAVKMHKARLNWIAKVELEMPGSVNDGRMARIREVGVQVIELSTVHSPFGNNLTNDAAAAVGGQKEAEDEDEEEEENDDDNDDDGEEDGGGAVGGRQDDGDHTLQSVASKRLDAYYEFAGEFFFANGHPQEALRLFQDETAPGGLLEQSNTMDAWAELARSLHQANFKLQAIEAFRQGAQVGRAAGEHEKACYLDTSQGLLCVEVGRFEEAQRIFARCVEFTKSTQDHHGYVLSLSNLGYAWATSGQCAAAIPLYEEAISYAKEHSPNSVRAPLLNLATSLQKLGRMDESLRIQHEVEDLIISKKARIERESQALEGQGGDDDDGAGAAGAAGAGGGDDDENDDADDDENNTWSDVDAQALGVAKSNQAATFLELGQYQQAAATYEVALEMARTLGDKLGEGKRLLGLGVAYCNLGEPARAREYLQQAADCFAAVDADYLVNEAAGFLESMNDEGNYDDDGSNIVQ